MRGLDDISQFFTQIIASGWLTTEAFFFLGGLLNYYSTRKSNKSGTNTDNVMQKIVRRLWRLYPTYIVSIFFIFLFTDTMGPMRTFVEKEYFNDCRKYWWQNLLFINNFFDIENTCLEHSWYIAADFQLFLISLFTVPVFFRNAKTGLILHIGMLISGLIATALWAWHKDIMPTNVVYQYYPKQLTALLTVYTTILPHIAPYYTGIITGHVLSTWKDFKIPAVFQIIGWVAASTCFISMLFISQTWNSGAGYTVAESAVYFACSRFLYSLAIAWLTVCCVKGHGGIINYILSLKVWIPISRISYMMYMISPVLQIFYFANLRMIVDYDRMITIWRYIGDLGISGLSALAMVVITESPFINMQKILFQKKITVRKNSKENNVNSKNNAEIQNNAFEEGDEIQIKLEHNIKNEYSNVNDVQ